MIREFADYLAGRGPAWMDHAVITGSKSIDRVIISLRA
jgi:hypothetical protein